MNTLPEMTFASKLDKQERNELILSCYKRKRGNELNFLIHREQREATSTGSLKKKIDLEECLFFQNADSVTVLLACGGRPRVDGRQTR